MRTSDLITLGFVAAFAAFNLQPYVGLRYSSCQTMYSGLLPVPPGNHLFLPRLAWSDNGDYWVNARIGGEGAHAYLNREFVRREIGQRCASGRAVSFQYEESGRSVR